MLRALALSFILPCEIRRLERNYSNLRKSVVKTIDRETENFEVKKGILLT